MDDEANKRNNFSRKNLSQTFDKYPSLIVYRVARAPIMDPPSEVSITGHAIRYPAAGRERGVWGCLGQIRNIWRNRNLEGVTCFSCFISSVFLSQLVKRGRLRKYNFYKIWNLRFFSVLNFEFLVDTCWLIIYLRWCSLDKICVQILEQGTTTLSWATMHCNYIFILDDKIKI